MIKLFWTDKSPDDGLPDIVVTASEKDELRDSKAILRFFCRKRAVYMQPELDLSFIEWAEAAGYDLSTLQFSIDKKKAGNSVSEGGWPAPVTRNLLL